MDKIRCSWAKSTLEREYHDQEWCQITHDDKKIFEFLILETMQAGLSWITILQKRIAFNTAFDNFDYLKIINYDEQKINQLIANKAIIRNKLKINAVISNAKNFIKVQEEFGSFDKYIWNFVNQEQIVNHWTKIAEIPAQSELSILISKDLKQRGFKFVGPTIVYSFLQAIGIIDDHLVSCFKSKNAN